MTMLVGAHGCLVHRRRIKKSGVMEDKVKEIEKKYYIITGSFKGRMLNLVGEEAEGNCSSFHDIVRGEKGGRKGFRICLF